MAYIPYDAKKINVSIQKKGKKFLLILSYYDKRSDVIYKVNVGERHLFPNAVEAARMYSEKYNIPLIDNIPTE